MGTLGADRTGVADKLGWGLGSGPSTWDHNIEVGFVRGKAVIVVASGPFPVPDQPSIPSGLVYSRHSVNMSSDLPE
jgi:hypothetical protein